MAYHKTRNPYHDYRSRCIYLITLNKAEGVADFSCCYKRDIGNGRWNGHVQYLGNGRIITEGLRAIQELYPQIRPLRYVVMPDHFHLVLENMVNTGIHIGTIIAKFTGMCNKRGAGGILFEPGYHDRILTYRGQLDRMIRYVDDNPRRLITKREHPEYFHSPFIIELWDRKYEIYGNYFLLRNPDISAVRISRRYTPQQLEELHKDWEETIRANGVLISPFISDREKYWERRAIAEGAGVILITRDEFGERYKPGGKFFDLCAEGRLLIISTGEGAKGGKLSRAESLAMNDLAARIAAGAPEDLRLRRR